jgi:2'-5' RNA ligase
VKLPSARGVEEQGPGERGRRLERLFVAVPMPADALPLVLEAQQSLPATPGLRLMTREQLHLTLAFIGEVGPEKRRAAEAVVRSVPTDGGGVLQSAGFLFLPSPRKARVVAVSLDDRQSIMGRLFEHVMAGLEEAEVMKREKRPFRAHLTIARLRDPAELQPKSECPRFGFPVESVCLFRSELRREGAQYTVLVRTRLDGGLSPEVEEE